MTYKKICIFKPPPWPADAPCSPPQRWIGLVKRGGSVKGRDTQPGDRLVNFCQGLSHSGSTSVVNFDRNCDSSLKFVTKGLFSI
jgi:hypothetical protein